MVSSLASINFIVAMESSREGGGMICRIYDVPGATLDQYDEVDRKVGEEYRRVCTSTSRE